MEVLTRIAAGPPNYDAINAAALRCLPELLARWLPGGLQTGHEYTVRNPKRGDRNPGNFVINTHRGLWSDFAVDVGRTRRGGACRLPVRPVPARSRRAARRHARHGHRWRPCLSDQAPSAGGDPAGDEATRLARGRRAMEHLASDPASAALVADDGERPGRTRGRSLCATRHAIVAGCTSFRFVAGRDVGAEPARTGGSPGGGSHPTREVRRRRAALGVPQRDRDSPLFAVRALRARRSGWPDPERDAALLLRAADLDHAEGHGPGPDPGGISSARPLPVPLYGLDRLAPPAPTPPCWSARARRQPMGARRPTCRGVVAGHQPGRQQRRGQGRLDPPWRAARSRCGPTTTRPAPRMPGRSCRRCSPPGAASVRVVSIPSTWPEGWDLGDELPEGATIEALQALLAAATEVAVRGLYRPPSPPPPGMSAAEIEGGDRRASAALPRPEYARTRKHAAQDLAIGVGELDGFVRQEARRAQGRGAGPLPRAAAARGRRGPLAARRVPARGRALRRW